jgi:peptidoglycan/LPS O-acetylase OafA/YrhL
MTVAASALRRDDLDSLRGLAVLSVVLFHLNVPVFTNGHLGVDVFFVLSGYFIFSSHCRANKSLYEFFSRRVWRIFPGKICSLTESLEFRQWKWSYCTSY